METLNSGRHSVHYRRPYHSPSTGVARHETCRTVQRGARTWSTQCVGCIKTCRTVQQRELTWSTQRIGCIQHVGANHRQPVECRLGPLMLLRIAMLADKPTGLHFHCAFRCILPVVLALLAPVEYVHCAVCSLGDQCASGGTVNDKSAKVSLGHGFAPRWVVPRVPEMTSGGLS